jgi:hypothetical protein
MFDSRFQSFDDAADPTQGKARVAALRQELRSRGLDGFLVPRSDEHQNEYVPKSAERLAWLSGFAGSAGLAIVLLDKAAIFVDGRYTLQVREQVDVEVFSPQHLVDAPPETWIEANLPKGGKLGYDPWLHTPGVIERYDRAAKAAGATLVPLESNPVDAIWHDRPQPPLGAVKLHDASRAGDAAPAKIARVREALAKAKSEALVISDTPSPGSSTFAAPTSSTRRCRCPTPACRRKVRRRSISTGASSPTAFAMRWAISSTLPSLQPCWGRWPSSGLATRVCVSTLRRRRPSSPRRWKPPAARPMSAPTRLP